jgi:hypothetical protein
MRQGRCRACDSKKMKCSCVICPFACGTRDSDFFYYRHLYLTMDSSDSADVFSHFGALDDLIQLLYQGQSRFVLLSNVADSDWTIHLRLSGQEGRCWRGKWLESDVTKIVVSSPLAYS